MVKKYSKYGTIAALSGIIIYMLLCNRTSQSYESIEQEGDGFVGNNVEKLRAMTRWCEIYEAVFFYIYGYRLPFLYNEVQQYGKNLPDFLKEHLILKESIFYNIFTVYSLRFNPNALSAIPVTIPLQSRKKYFESRLKEHMITEKTQEGIKISIYYNSQLYKEWVV